MIPSIAIFDLSEGRLVVVCRYFGVIDCLLFDFICRGV
jgi:hypothetical protein